MTTRVERGELLAAIVAALAVTGLTVGATVVSQQLRVAGGCVDRGCFGPAGAPWAAFVGSLDGWLSPLQGSLPFVVGALFGVPLIARELETGTGRLTWALSGSRGRWLRWRLAPVVLLTIVLLVPAAAAGQGLVHQASLLDPWNSFDDYWLRGPTIVTRGLGMLGLALFVGAAMRRVLPGFIATALVAVVLYGLLDWALGVPVWTSPVACPPSPTSPSSVPPWKGRPWCGGSSSPTRRKIGLPGGPGPSGTTMSSSGASTSQPELRSIPLVGGGRRPRGNVSSRTPSLGRASPRPTRSPRSLGSTGTSSQRAPSKCVEVDGSVGCYTKC